MAEGPSEASQEISFRGALRVWARIGILSFGGPAGQIALMHRELVEERRWISEARFLHALNYCMLLPGPEAQQLAVYIGWLMHRTPGGLAAGILFVAPGALVILALSILYAQFQALPAVVALFFGLKAAVLAIVCAALLRIAQRALRGRLQIAVALAAFLAIFAFDVPFPLIVLGAGLLGAIAFRMNPDFFPRTEDTKSTLATDHFIDRQFERGALTHVQPNLARSVRTLFVSIAIWVAPIVVVALWHGVESVYVREGFFFSEAAVVTFGGAYSVLSYVAQRAVEDFAWLRPGEMLDGLALAETTPGPLILVLQFVAYLGAYRLHGAMHPVASGLLGSFVTLWVTFVPCFLWIFLGAPYVEALRNLRVLNAALACVTAAVVGVILNLSLWFAMHTLFGEVRAFDFGVLHVSVPNWSTLNIAAALLTAIALIATLRFRASMPLVLGVSAGLGFLTQML